jgi:hypothetical protein
MEDFVELRHRQKPSARQRAKSSAWAMCLEEAGRLQSNPTRLFVASCAECQAVGSVNVRSWHIASFAATQKFGRFRSEADIHLPALTEQHL